MKASSHLLPPRSQNLRVNHRCLLIFVWAPALVLAYFFLFTPQSDLPTLHTSSSRKTPRELTSLGNQSSAISLIRFVDRYHGVPGTYNSFNDMETYTEGNAGNMIWQYAAYEILLNTSSNTICSHSYDLCAETIPNFSRSQTTAFEPSDNRLGGGFDFYPTVKSIMRNNENHIFIGIGAQIDFLKHTHNADFDPNGYIQVSPTDAVISESAQALLHLQQERRVPMFFRGRYTDAVARKFGYTHGIVSGCPSLMINPDLYLGQTMQKKYKALKERKGDTTLKIGLNIKPRNIMFKWFLNILRQYENSKVYAQDLYEIRHLRRQGIPFERIEFFKNAEDWITSLREMDVVIGVRIHGNMAALAASVPLYVIAYDYRVLELAEILNLPHTTVFDPRLSEKNMDIVGLITDKSFDGTKFDVNRCRLAKLYRQYFNKLAVTVSNQVLAISNQC